MLGPRLLGRGGWLLELVSGCFFVTRRTASQQLGTEGRADTKMRREIREVGWLVGRWV